MASSYSRADTGGECGEGRRADLMLVLRQSLDVFLEKNLHICSSQENNQRGKGSQTGTYVPRNPLARQMIYIKKILNCLLIYFFFRYRGTYFCSPPCSRFSPPCSRLFPRHARAFPRHARAFSPPCSRLFPAMLALFPRHARAFPRHARAFPRHARA